MGNTYQAVQWNKIKKQYDGVMISFILIFLIVFVVFHFIFRPNISIETLLIRAFGILAIVLLHVILSIGPLARISSRFKILLYNRRHLGVTMFIMAAVHGGIGIGQFHALGNENPIVSIFTSNTDYNSLRDFPFQTLGFVALIILFLMAATSHDFWLKNLSPRVWKSLHMMVYGAYVLIILHVALGALQDERSTTLLELLLFGVVVISGLHILAGALSTSKKTDNAEWVEVGIPDDIPDNSAVTIRIDDKKIAIFKYDNQLSAVSNYCRHQGGPLGEGGVVDGCITCPWHGFQYYPNNGCAPPPFEEKLETYLIKLENDKIFLDPRGFKAGTAVEPLKIK